MKSLIERHQAVACVAPSMREIPIGENLAALNFAEELFAGRVDVVVFMTGSWCKDAPGSHRDAVLWFEAGGGVGSILRNCSRPQAKRRHAGMERQNRLPCP